MPERRRIEPCGGPLRGELRVPGDKSVSHRALLLSSVASGPSRIRGLLDSADVRATAAAVEAMGVSLASGGGELVVQPPARGLGEPDRVLDCGNSGTSIRLLAGLIAAHSLFAVLTGDESLRRRPMERIVSPLRRMGARIEGRSGGSLAPLAIRGGGLEAVHHDLEIASAQVKSALLLAGLRCGVAVREPAQSRDHTERMLRSMGAILRRDPEGWLLLVPQDEPLQPVDVQVPGDLSSAAFFLVAAAIVEGSEVTIRDLGLNPTRSGVLDVLRQMGAELSVEPRGGTSTQGEPIGDVTVRGGALRGALIGRELSLRALDELPIVAVAAAVARGRTTIEGAAELRVKESDRIARVVEGLRALGVAVEEHPDGMTIWGGALSGPARIDASGDHRIAMAFAVAGLVAPGGVELVGAEQVKTSYPGFFEDLVGLTG